MIIDTHLHTMEGSPDSFLPLERAVARAKELSMDGICITDHDTLKLAPMAEELSDRYDFLILVGAEILTYEGDLLVYGLDRLPEKKMHAPDLAELVSSVGGASAAAHPFRDNGRGMGEVMRLCPHMHGVETFNGSTKPHHNEMALETALDINSSMLGGSDSHWEDRIGLFATRFHRPIRSMTDLVNAVREGATSPVRYDKDVSSWIHPEAYLRSVAAPVEQPIL